MNPMVFITESRIFTVLFMSGVRFGLFDEDGSHAFLYINFVMTKNLHQVGKRSVFPVKHLFFRYIRVLITSSVVVAGGWRYFNSKRNRSFLHAGISNAQVIIVLNLVFFEQD
jgi:hypothetical protein